MPIVSLGLLRFVKNVVNLVLDIACSLSRLLLHDTHILQPLHTCKCVC